MARKTRSDIKIGNLEKKLGLGAGAIKNPNGTDARSDKKLGTLRSDFKAIKTNSPKKTSTTNSVKPKIASTASVKSKTTVPKKRVTSVPANATSDQKKASIRVVKHNPKASSRVVQKVRKAIKKSVKK